MDHLECTATPHWCNVDTVMCTKWHTWRCYAYHWEVCHPTVWQDQHMHRHWQGPMKTLCKEDQCEADPAYQGSSGTACKESNLPGWSHIGSVTASNSCNAFANQLGLDKDRGWSVRTEMDNLTWGFKSLLWAGIMQVQEGLRESLQIQEGCTSVHSSVCMWRGVFAEFSLYYINWQLLLHACDANNL